MLDESLLLECEKIYQMTVSRHMTVRQIADKLNLGKSTIDRRIRLIKDIDPDKYLEVKKVMSYNKRYRFKKRRLWEPFDTKLLEDTK